MSSEALDTQYINGLAMIVFPFSAVFVMQYAIIITCMFRAITENCPCPAPPEGGELGLIDYTK